jgi:hypothetical protein
MAIVGIILLIISGILFWVQRNQKQKIFSIKSARKVTAAELNETASGVAAEIGGGSWRDYVKVWGKIQVDEPPTVRAHPPKVRPLPSEGAAGV